MKQLTEVQQTTAIQEQDLQTKLAEAERKAKDLKSGSQNELREQQDRHSKAISDIERVHETRLKESKSKVERLEEELAAAQQQTTNSLN